MIQDCSNTQAQRSSNARSARPQKAARVSHEVCSLRGLWFLPVGLYRIACICAHLEVWEHGKIGWMPHRGGSVLASGAHLIRPQWQCRGSIVSLHREPCLVLSAHYLRTTDPKGGDEKTDTPRCRFFAYLYNSFLLNQPALSARTGEVEGAAK